MSANKSPAGPLWWSVRIVSGGWPGPPWVNLIGLATVPLFAWALGEPAAVIAAGGAMFFIVSLKRLDANREPLPPGEERWQVLKRQWLLDRDMEDWETWISRRPEGAAPSWRIAAKQEAEGREVQG